MKYPNAFSNAVDMLISFMLTMAIMCCLCPELTNAQGVPSAVAETLEPGKFVLTVKDGKVFLIANKADVREMLIALSKAANIELKCVGDLRKAKSVTLNGSSVEDAIRRIAKSYIMEFVRAPNDSVLKLATIHAIPSNGKDANVSISASPFPVTMTGQMKFKAVAVNVAQVVAIDYLPKFRPGEWVPFDRFTYYDLDGQPAVYLFIFRKPTLQITTREGVMLAINNTRRERDAALGRIEAIKTTVEIPEGDRKNKLREFRNKKNALQRAMYMTADFQTVMTGATNVSKPLIRCYRGLPAAFVRKEELQRKLNAEHPGKALQLQEVICLGSFDLFYKAGDYLVSVRDGSLQKMEEMKKRLDAAAATKAENTSKLTERQRHVLAEQEELRKKHYILRWAEYMRREKAK